MAIFSETCISVSYLVDLLSIGLSFSLKRSGYWFLNLLHTIFLFIESPFKAWNVTILYCVSRGVQLTAMVPPKIPFGNTELSHSNKLTQEYLHG